MIKDFLTVFNISNVNSRKKESSFTILLVFLSLIGFAATNKIATGIKGFNLRQVEAADTLVKGTRLLITDTAVTVGAPSGITTSLIDDEWGFGGFWTYDHVNYKIYAYKIVDGKYVFSEQYASLAADLSITIGGSTWVSVSFTPVPGASGYRVFGKYSSSMFPYYNSSDSWFADITNNSFVDCEYMANGGIGYDNEIFFDKVGAPPTHSGLFLNNNVIDGALKINGPVNSNLILAGKSVIFYSDSTMANMGAELKANSKQNFSFGLNNSTSGGNNVLVGSGAGQNNSGSSNIGIGFEPLSINSGYHNIAVGFRSLRGNINGGSNLALGMYAGATNLSGSNNIYLGNNAGSGITTGSYNTIIGSAYGLNSSLSNTVILADGQGNQRFYSPSSGNVLVGYPNNPTDNGFKLDVNGTGRFTGTLAIGTTNVGTYKLAVGGRIKATEVKVDPSHWYDHVFNKSYQLAPLNEVESFVKTNNHLPGIPSEKEVKKEGIDVGEMTGLLLKKIEELTLYMIEKNKQLESANQKIEDLAKEVRALKVQK